MKREIRLWRETIKTCFEISWRASSFYTILRLAGNLLPALGTVWASFLGKYLLDILAGTSNVNNPYQMCIVIFIGLLVTAVCRAMIQKAGQYAQSMHEDIMRKDLSLNMMEKASDADIEYFDNPLYYDRLTACTRDISAIQYLMWNILSALSAGISFCAVFLILSFENIVYSLAILVAAIPASFASVKYVKLIYQLGIDQIKGERQKDYLQSLTIDRAYVKSLKLFNAGAFLRNKYQKIWEDLFVERRNVSRSRTIITAIMECLPEITTVGIGLSLSFDVLRGKSTVGDYSLYSGLVEQLWNSVLLFTSAVLQILDNRLKIKNLQTLDALSNHVKDEGVRNLSCVEAIEFEHVSFTYPGTEKPVLEDVSFTIQSKERVAVVGLNGSGKSTLIKLLLRFYDVDRGSIRINGIDIREYRLTDLRKNFSVYFQDEPSYSFSLRENIVISDLGIRQRERQIEEALVDGDCTDIRAKGKKGLDTGITRLFDEDGIELSIGQYQKIALSRTLFRRHTALILDEPSSSLDPKAEHFLFEHLKEKTSGKTTLFTSHRLTNISLADRIIVLERGKVIEEGTQKELLRLDGRYAQLFHYQQEHFLAAELD